MGLWKLLLLLTVVLVVFGPGKLPNAMKDIAKGLKNFKDEFGKDEKETETEAAKIITVSPEKKKES